MLARFEANVPADVFLFDGASPVKLGTTDFEMPLPSGVHRILFRAPGQLDWDSVQRMPAAGRTYRVARMDYPVYGSLVATVTGTWAQISVDGAPARESPVRFETLRAGPHIVVVSRQGYATQTDTVLVQGGQVVRRQYTLHQ